MNAKTAQTAPQTKNAPSGAQAPLKTIRFGRLKATIWENEAENRKYHNVVLTRTYRDGEGEFHDTDSFGRDDLLLLAKLADQAHTVIHERLVELASEE